MLFGTNSQLCFIDEDVLETIMVDVNAVDTNGLDVSKADTTHLYHDN